MENKIILKNKSGEDIEIIPCEIPNRINMDELTEIDYSNIYYELCIIPTLINVAGSLRSDSEKEFKRKKIILELTENKKFIHYRQELTKEVNGRLKSPTEKEVSAHVSLDKEVRRAKSALITAENNFQNMDSFFWSVKSKEKSLNNIGLSIQLHPEDFLQEITEKWFKGFKIRLYKNEK